MITDIFGRMAWYKYQQDLFYSHPKSQRLTVPDTRWLRSRQAQGQARPVPSRRRGRLRRVPRFTLKRVREPPNPSVCRGVRVLCVPTLVLVTTNKSHHHSASLSEATTFDGPTVQGPRQDLSDDSLQSSAFPIGRSGDNPSYEHQAGQDSLLANPGFTAKSVCTPPSSDAAGSWTPAPKVVLVGRYHAERPIHRDKHSAAEWNGTGRQFVKI